MRRLEPLAHSRKLVLRHGGHKQSHRHETVHLINLTRANEIGANCYLIEWDGLKLVLDAGLHPRLDGPAALPDTSLLPPGEIDAFFVSHAHLDHVGSLPVLMRNQPEAHVLMTEPTGLLADPLLHNAANVMHKRAEEGRDAVVRLFGHAEVSQSVKRWRSCPLERERALGDLRFQFFASGHILGAAGIRIEGGGSTLFYTGDVNFRDQTLSRKAAFPHDRVDALIVETTRGAAPAPPDFSRKAELSRLAEKIRAVFERKGAILMPAFALGKTQEAISAIHAMIRRDEIPECPVFIGGLSWRLTALHDGLADEYPRDLPKLRIIEHIGPRLLTGREIGSHRLIPGAIYLLSSGMMIERTLSNLLAQRMLAEERHAIFFIGYCDPASPAGRLRAAHADGTRVELDPRLGPQPIHCEVDHFELTAHALREDILEYILSVDPKHVVLVHGDPAALEWFRGEIVGRRPTMRVTIPAPGARVPL
ncbi:MAG TPA: MBL fold metallo-hydrolase [Verrucomicrobiae bacterium]|nr:MBL fold metallo-hydrolase [Verrucomicrobiae bacterium]